MQQTWTVFLIQFVFLLCAARRSSLERSGYDGQNWPASLVIDTSNLPDNSAQHDLFYGGSAFRSNAAFEQEERAQSTNVDQRAPTTQSSRFSTTQHVFSRPEFSSTQRITTQRPTFSSQLDRTEYRTTEPMGRRTTQPPSRQTSVFSTEETWRQTTPMAIQQQFDGYGEQRVPGRERQSWQTVAENQDPGRFGRIRQETRRPIISNEYEGIQTQISSNRQQESHEDFGQSRDSFNPRRGDFHNNEQSEYENPQISTSQDRRGLMVGSVGSGYDGVNREFNIDNSGRRSQQTNYESQAVFSPSRDHSRDNPRISQTEEQQARLVARLLNIDRLAGYTSGAEDSRSDAFERTERPPPSPFSNDAYSSNATIGEINEILTRPLNASDQPFEDKNLQHATIEILKLLHDEPQAKKATQNQQTQSKETMKVAKKVRVIHLPPMSNEDDSEEIILVGERGNTTVVHRDRTSMSIHPTT